jgi:hypothetical protein
MARNEMVKRCFFNWTNIYYRGLTINNGIEFAFLVLSVSTKTPFPFVDETFPRTEKTLDILSI